MDNIYQSQASSALFQCSRYSAAITDRNVIVSLSTLNNYNFADVLDDVETDL